MPKGVTYTDRVTGPMQLDGLVRGKRFDLILRSTRALPSVMRADLTRILDDALGATGMEGSLVFESGASFAASPLRDLERRNAALSRDMTA